MNTAPLFLDKPLEFDGEEKLAGMLTKLSDNTDNWPQEIMQEAYKQLPYLSDFEIHVSLDKLDEERGFAFGSIIVRSKSDMTPEEEEKSTKLRKAHIPIIIKEQKLCPLDIFMDGKKYQHLTEGRLRQSMYRPDMFDVARLRPPEASLLNDLHPPAAAGYGFGGSGIKAGAALQLVPLLPQLHGRVLERHVERMKTAMKDPSLHVCVSNGAEGVRAAFESASQLETSNIKQAAEYVYDRIRPNVVQFRKLQDGNVMMKWANTEMFSPREESIPSSVASDLIGEQDMVQQLEGDGSLSLSPDIADKDSLEAEEIEVVNKFGLWKVQDTTGNSLVGWVFPQLLTFDLQPMPLALFNNGSQSALQERVAGSLAGKSTDIPKGVPKGYGTLYYIDHGTAKAFIPINVNTTYRGPDGHMKYVGSTDMGDQIAFSFGPGLKTVVKVGENEYVVPDFFNWMPLRGQTELVSDPSVFSKVASAKKGTSVAELLIDGDVYSFRGPAVAKLAHHQTKFIGRPEAEFLTVALGHQSSKLKTAESKVVLRGCNVITPLSEKIAAARAAVRKELDELDPPIHNYFLAKEAAILDDALTADKILGLGFINAENIATFVDMLPTLEECSSKLAELLLAVRAGVKEVPEVAVERMLAAVEDVIRGLKSLRQKELTHTV